MLQLLLLIMLFIRRYDCSYQKQFWCCSFNPNFLEKLYTSQVSAWEEGSIADSSLTLCCFYFKHNHQLKSSFPCPDLCSPPF